jgi:hypothetical protein
MWLIGNSWEMGQLSTRTCILYIACPNKWSFGILLSWAAWVVCIVKMLSQIAIFLARLGRPPINSWASPYFVNAIYIRPGAGPSLHSSPKCSRPYQNIVVTSLSLSLSCTKCKVSQPPFLTQGCCPFLYILKTPFLDLPFLPVFVAFVATARGQQIIVSLG